MSSVRVAIVDSGVNFAHPHLGVPPDGLSLVGGGLEDPAGHGTCVAALVHWIAPEAQLDAIKVLPRDLRVSSALLAQAIEAAVARGARIVNVSIGTTDGTHVDRLRTACEAATRAGATVVAAALSGRTDMLPAGLDGVVAVAPAVPPLLLREDASGWPRWTASSVPRPAEGRWTNFRGPSFAAARVTGILARLAAELDDAKLLCALSEIASGVREAPWLT
ncbi:MAG: S8 family serine peptidase [Deltaproteobacteria bacterium]|nr:S8 family serine peptidase [Deltaproteobacteria bacterium]